MRTVWPASISLIVICTLVPSADGSSTFLTYPSATRVLCLLAMSMTVIMLRILPESECDGHRHHDRHWLSIQQRWREPPLPHRFHCRIAPAWPVEGLDSQLGRLFRVLPVRLAAEHHR